ncbi:hypothetical protein LYNGBM3L_57590 [Moorena producens 3L]|uniref:Uncharacterized protein n=1 Tax=Moorena producens 3L TaxID=489825 RepID=F4XZI3_9CYAN|nr:hypothetical protein LYNGBM3L_57590 [Moorena producens 3L]
MPSKVLGQFLDLSDPLPTLHELPPVINPTVGSA